MKLLSFVFVFAALSASAQERIVTRVSETRVVRASDSNLTLDAENADAKKLSLDAYPNPANAEITITFSLPTKSTAKIVFYDMSGKVRATISDEQQSAGKHEIKYDLSKTPTGSYILGLVTGSDQRSKVIKVVR
jgi:hypothetical protein